LTATGTSVGVGVGVGVLVAVGEGVALAVGLGVAVGVEVGDGTTVAATTPDVLWGSGGSFSRRHAPRNTMVVTRASDSQKMEQHQRMRVMTTGANTPQVDVRR
jgi:hypothetical protein